MRCSNLYLFSIKYPKAPKNSPGGLNIWLPFHKYKTRIYGSIALVERFNKSYLFSLENWVLCLLKVHCLCNSFFCSKLKKNIIFFLYCTCEPLLFVKDENYVNKEYEEANEQSIVVRRWGCTFCWSRRIVSHDGSRRPCHPAHGKAAGSQNQYWKRKIKNMN